jgi:hypothetical protein
MAGRAPRLAGAGGGATERKYAVWVLDRPGGPPSLQQLERELRRCGIDNVVVYPIDSGGSDIRFATLYGAMREQGITTVLLQLPMVHASSVMSHKPKDDYNYEWVLGASPADDNELQWMLLAPPEQRRNLFGLFSPSKLIAGDSTPAYWAWREFDEDARAAVAEDPYFVAQYRELLLLASGIQLAGPNLTPESFARALPRARFPNPGAGAAPYYQSTVGFGPDDYTMTKDFAAVWWSETASSYTAGSRTAGAFCYVGRGERFSAGRWRDVMGEMFAIDPRDCR